MTEQQTYDLLKPPQLPELYIHQLKQTIQAYSPSQIVVGEALQNSIDAVYQSGGGDHLIRLNIDFDSRTISIEDDGIGFPNDATLLFLGGTRKREAAKKLFGLVGVGIKVVLFRSRFFMLRSRTEEGAFRLEISDAYRFGNGGHALQVPTSFPKDSQPLDKSGTQITYTFPEGTIGDPLKQFVQELQVRCLPHGVDRHFGKTLGHSVSQKVFPNRFAALFCAFLRRFTYAGDVMNQLGNKPELSNTKLKVQISCSNPVEQFGSEMGGLFDGNTKFEFEIKPEYLLVEDVFNWVPTHVRLGLYREALGKGGEGLSRTFKGFNVLRYVEAEDYEKLITDQQGNLADDIEEYRERLFPQINGIILTIGRIPHFDEFLPGGSRRVLSANGVVTSHDLDLTRGRNLEYVRCFDMVIDLDAKLNYGKAQLTDLYLVNRARRFVNDAYASVIQRAAGNWVGRIPPDTGDELDNFLSRPDLGLPDYILRKAPTDENDVIALFFELAGRGFFPEYRLFGLSQKDKYDARAMIKRVGDSSIPSIPPDERRLLVVEFKVVAASLIKDLDREEKDAKDMHLLIAWEEGTSVFTRFGFADIEHSRDYPKNVFPRVQRYLEDTRTGAQVQVLLLKPIIDEELRKIAAAK